MCQRAFRNDITDAHAAVERGERVLKDGLHAGGDFARTATSAHDRLARETNGAGCRHGYAGCHASERRFARTRFTDKAKHLASFQRDRDAIHGLHDCLRLSDAGADRQVLEQAGLLFEAFDGGIDHQIRAAQGRQVVCCGLSGRRGSIRDTAAAQQKLARFCP
ncbi:hypothetical protein D3C80_501390 [compost metagenome]